MNQFKKARQRAIETGHQVENIADLKTAGIKQEPKEEQKKVEEKPIKEVSIHNPEQQTNSDALETEKTQVDNESIDKNTTQNTILVESPKNEDFVNEEVNSDLAETKTATPEIDVAKTNINNTISEQVSNIPIQAESQNSEIVTSAVTPINKVAEEIPAQVISQTQATNAQIQPVIKEHNTVNTSYSNAANTKTENHELENIIIEPETETLITELEPSQKVPTTNAIPIPQRVPQTFEVNQQPQAAQSSIYQTEQFKVPSQATRNTASKKNIPNIFAPKGEAKSMRKSLVLKPTSVKIAENYCAKNGGSFNELIQTLLDNFIDEYGL